MIDIIQIGANVGNSDADPVWPVLQQNPTATAYLIEPNPKAYAKLKENYKPFPNVKCFNYAVGDADGTITLYVDNYENTEGTSVHASCSYKHLLGHGHAEDEHPPTALECRQVTLYSFLKEEGILDEEIGALVIDAEGYDEQIIKSIDFGRISINRVWFEWCHIGGPHARDPVRIRELNAYLTSFGYQVSPVDQVDAIAIKLKQ